MAVPLGHNNPPPEQLFQQGAESPWMPEPDVMELPDADTLYPIVCEHMHKLNAKTSPVFIAIAAPLSEYAEKRIPTVSGRGTGEINARLFAVVMEKAEIPACCKVATIIPFNKRGGHWMHAAQVKRPNASPRLHAALIDSKQAYDTIPREELLELWTLDSPSVHSYVYVPAGYH
eukprot:1156152-Pelagomonas_calceolata.AAC.8